MATAPISPHLVRVAAVWGTTVVALKNLDHGQSFDMTTGPNSILLHGHCHQKSMGLVAPARKMLSQISGTTVVDLDAGCCGMAGSFGYSRDHFDVSRTIGERKLFPAVRNKGEGAVVVAIDTSVPAGESSQISVDFTRSTPGIREDVLLVDVTLSGTTIRYPITLRAE